MDTKQILDAARDIGKYVLVSFSVYFVAIIVHIVLGIFQESVVPALGLNATGTAVTAIDTLITGIGTAITSIVALITVVTGLMVLVIVLKLFGFNLNFNMGSNV